MARTKANTKRLNIHLERYDLINALRTRFSLHHTVQVIPSRALSDAVVVDMTLAILDDVMKTFPEPRYRIVDTERLQERWPNEWPDPLGTALDDCCPRNTW